MGNGYIQSVLEDTETKFQSGMAQGAFKRAPTRQLSPTLVKLFKVLDGDPVLIEATLAWAKTKKAEVDIAKMVTLRGREYVEAMVEKINKEKRDVPPPSKA